MKGIVLAGGSGSRLYPITKVYSKQLTLIYDKPLIYYPLSILMLAGIKDILIISNKESIPLYKQLFEDGSQIGLNISYKEQESPRGIAEAFIIGEEFIGDDNVTLILGDNIYYGKLDYLYNGLKEFTGGATIFGYQVNNPSRYGIIEFDKSGNPVTLVEKPKQPRSNYAITGLYIYDSDVVDIAKNLSPSGRGELEITDVNRKYLKRGKLNVQMLGRGVAWLDTGNPEALLKASNFFGVIEDRQGLKVACIEEIAFRKGFIDRDSFNQLINNMPKSMYREYLEKILHEE
jgi:glucose-1-phosphate thymidylyltransferase